MQKNENAHYEQISTFTSNSLELSLYKIHFEQPLPNFKSLANVRDPLTISTHKVLHNSRYPNTPFLFDNLQVFQS